MHLILKSVKDLNISESLLRKRQKGMWWYFPSTYGLWWLWIASKLPLPLPGYNTGTAPAIMVLAWPSLTHTGSMENSDSCSFYSKDGHNVRAEQQHHPPLLRMTSQCLEVPMEHYTIHEKPRFKFLFWTRSHLSNLLQESRQYYISVHSLSFPMDFFFPMAGKLERLQKKTPAPASGKSLT